MAGSIHRGCIHIRHMCIYVGMHSSMHTYPNSNILMFVSRLLFIILLGHPQMEPTWPRSPIGKSWGPPLHTQFQLYFFEKCRGCRHLPAGSGYDFSVDAMWLSTLITHRCCKCVPSWHGPPEHQSINKTQQQMFTTICSQMLLSRTLLCE